jgi:flagellar FliL protein
MKKNLISVLILALLIVNVILTGVMMFSVTSASKKTASLVDDIATALNLELASDSESVDEEVVAISLGDTKLYDIEAGFTVPMKKGIDGEDHFGVFSVSLSLNKEANGFKEYGETVANYESKIKSIIIDVVSSYTKDEANEKKDEMLDEILNQIQTMYDSKFIYEVMFTNVTFQ